MNKQLKLIHKFFWVLAILLFFGTSHLVQADTVISAVPDTTESNQKTEDSTEVSDKQEDEDTTVIQGWNEKKTSYYENGKKVTGMKKIDNQLYYFDKKGKLYTKSGLQTIGGATYYFNKDHTLKTGVVKVKGKYYYFQKKNGVRYEESGVKKVDGSYYCFTKKYTLKSGWYRNSKNKQYYFDKKTFAALIGWNYVGEYKYYFDDKGRLCQDVRKKLTKAQKKSYYIEVSKKSCVVTVFAKDTKKNKYTVPVISFICSPGDATPTGTFKIKDKLRWHELMGPSWGQWCEHLTDDILFHSVYYDKQNDNKTLNVAAYNKLGTVASHGCIRLTAGDAKWIYDNCDVGTEVKITTKKKSTRFDKPKAQKLSSSHTWDPTDPNIK
jgi:hypothetical protein